MSIHLGANPLQLTYAYRGAIESSLDVASSLGECCENSRDYAKNIVVTLYGKPETNRPGIINLTTVTIEDDGVGMDFATMYERFRGAYFDSGSHSRTDQSGRNGVGVKTNLQYWGEIYVETTTKNDIPGKMDWDCSEDNRDIIESIYRKNSTLKAGDPDTEIRSMSFSVEGAELFDPKPCNKSDSFTVVTLKKPRQNILFNVASFIKKQSHCIDWLDNKDHSFIVKHKDVNGNWKSVTIKSCFNDEDGKNSKNNYLCHVKGNSKEDLHIIHQDTKTHPSVLIPANTDSDVGPIELDIKVMDKVDENDTSHNDFVISVCGANVYDRERSGPVPPAVSYLMGLASSLKSTGGFSYRLHGYIKTNDERLKKALRHNKSALDMENKYTSAFFNYIVKEVLKPLNVIYINSQDTLTSLKEEQIIKEIIEEFNNVCKRVREKMTQKRAPSEEKREAEPVKHKEWKCNNKDCGQTWRTLLNKEDPFCCAEFSVDKSIVGCGCTDIERNTHAKNDAGVGPVGVKFVKDIGNFLPAKYEPNEHCINISRYHPAYITNATGQKEVAHRKTTILENCFFALAVHNAVKDNRPVDIVYGELLKDWFENRNTSETRSYKDKCHKIWKDAGITIDQL